MRRFLTILSVVSLFVMTGMFALPSPGHAAGASMYLTTSKKTMTVGSTVTVGIVVDPNGSSVDTVRAVVDYPSSLVSITSFVQSGYMPNKSPGSSYSNNSGILNWGGFTTEGPVTTTGTFGTITFKALQTGTATISVMGGSHIIFGGEEQLASRGSVTIDIIQATTPPVPPTPPKPVTPKPTTPPSITPPPVLPPTPTPPIQPPPPPIIVPPIVTPRYDIPLTTLVPELGRTSLESVISIGALLIAIVFLLLIVIYQYLSRVRLDAALIKQQQEKKKAAAAIKKKRARTAKKKV